MIKSHRDIVEIVLAHGAAAVPIDPPLPKIALRRARTRLRELGKEHLAEALRMRTTTQPPKANGVVTAPVIVRRMVLRADGGMDIEVEATGSPELLDRLDSTKHGHDFNVGTLTLAERKQ